MTELAKLILPPIKPAYNAWPDVAPGKRPIGVWVLVQYKVAQRITAGGLHLTDEAIESDQYGMSAARVIAIGSVAFKDQVTGDDLPGAPWFGVGDFVRVPITGGDMFKVKADPDDVYFAFWKDSHLKAIDDTEAEEYERLWKKG